MTKHVLIVACFIITVSSYAQNCSVIFSGPDAFRVSINKKEQYSNFTTDIRINDLNSKNMHVVQIEFNGDTTTVKSNLYLLDDGFMHLYSVSKTGIQLTKMLPELSYESSKTIGEISYVSSGVEQKLITKVDTVVIDTSYTPEFEDYYHLEDYKGKIACAFPIKSEELIVLKNKINTESIDDSKLEKIKEAISFMDEPCFLVDQILELILLFEYEETRLEFAKYMFQYAFDVDNYKKLNEAFNLEYSKEELKKFIDN